MCLAVIALNQVAGIPVLIAANRDEFHARPTAPAAAWPGEPRVYAGRDLRAGGTWMGTADNGRYAVVTNYREVGRQIAEAPSRGALVERYLAGGMAARDYIFEVARQGAAYNGFNLIIGDAQGAWYYGNRDAAPRALDNGIHALSNHLLDTPWPKLVRLKSAVAQVLAHGPQPDLPALFAALADRTAADDAALPRTGLSLARERLLSSPFIVSPDYGTRCSTVMLWRDNGQGELHERRFTPEACLAGESDLTFSLRAP
ncbi:NRDE family protein [Bordetella genomosp. 12]|uniref:NRDE family protein n=1 Tax=Bordetella genomosp. 12 TaxID=463035 RepID=UPI001177E3C9|nr:NRDE family protein [Bordetella genomosp. 12]